MTSKSIPLTRLRLNNSRCLLETLTIIFTSFNLEELSIEQTKVYLSIEESDEPIHDSFFALLPPLPKSLMALNISCNKIDNETLIEMVSPLSRLKHLNISNLLHGIDLDVFIPAVVDKFQLESFQAWRIPTSDIGNIFVILMNQIYRMCLLVYIRFQVRLCKKCT